MTLCRYGDDTRKITRDFVSQTATRTCIDSNTYSYPASPLAIILAHRCSEIDQMTCPLVTRSNVKKVARLPFRPRSAARWRKEARHRSSSSQQHPLPHSTNETCKHSCKGSVTHGTVGDRSAVSRISKETTLARRPICVSMSCDADTNNIYHLQDSVIKSPTEMRSRASQTPWNSICLYR